MKLRIDGIEYGQQGLTEPKTLSTKSSYILQAVPRVVVLRHNA